MRGGLLTFTSYTWAMAMFSVVQPAAASGSWARGPQLQILAVLFAVIGLGAWMSMAGRPILGDVFSEKPPAG